MNKKRIFTSFAIEDKNLRDFLIGQKKLSKSTFDFVDMSVKKPWETQWKTNCRIRIKGCNGMIIIVTKNTHNADGQLWEIKCAKEENIPLYCIYGNKENHPKNIPLELKDLRIHDWTWMGIENWINSLEI